MFSLSLIEEYYPYLQKDIGEILGYILPGLEIGIVGAVIVLIGCRIFIHEWNWRKAIAYFLFVSYVAIVIQIAYLSRQPGSRTDVAFGLGDTWGTTIQAHAYVIENIIMFIPFGLVFPLLGKKAKWICLPLAILSSCALEGMQYITGRGYCQLDDVITNVIGAFIGYVVFMLVYLMIIIIRRIKED